MNLKGLLKSGLAIAVFALSACGRGDLENEGSSDAQINLMSKKIYLLPGKSTSCKSYADGLTNTTAPTQDISGKYFSLKNLSFTWNGSDNFTIAYLKVSFSSANITIQDFVFTEEELMAAVRIDTSTGSAAWSTNDYNGGIIAAGDTLTLSCPLKVGSISVPANQNTQFEINAKVTLVGFFQSGSDEIPTSTSQEFTLINLPE